MVVVLPVCMHLCISTQMFPERSDRMKQELHVVVVLPVCTHLCIYKLSDCLNAGKFRQVADTILFWNGKRCRTLNCTCAPDEL